MTDWHVLIKPDGDLVRSIDGEEPGYLLYPSYDAAVRACAEQNELHDLHCHAARLSTVGPDRGPRHQESVAEQDDRRINGLRPQHHIPMPGGPIVRPGARCPAPGA